jgi:hypothetical protein
LVRAAVLAPTPDNNQPWRFVSQGERLLVHLDPTRALPSDVNSMFDLIGLGAAVENAAIAARQMGYEPSVEYAPVTAGSAVENGSQPAVTMTFTPGGRPDPLYGQLEDRCTCRKLYKTRPLARQSLEALADAAKGFSEVQLDWITDRARIRALARVMAASDRIRFEYEPFHNELFRQLRFTVDEAERTRDGLDLRTLELPPGAGLMLRPLGSWSRMKWVHRLGLGRLLTAPSALSVRLSGAIGVLSVAQPTSAGFLQGGRAFERIWLAAQAENLALQPLGSLSIFSAHLKLLAGKKLCQPHKERIGRLIGRFGELAPTVTERTLLIMFRLGHAAPPKRRSLRRPAEAVFETAPQNEGPLR